MQQKFHQSSVILRVFAVILTCSFFAVAVTAQEKGANVAPASQAGTVVQKLTLDQQVAGASAAAPGGSSVAGKNGQSASRATPQLPETTSTPRKKNKNKNPPNKQRNSY